LNQRTREPACRFSRTVPYQTRPPHRGRCTEEGGFEPPNRIYSDHLLSRQALLTARALFQVRAVVTLATYVSAETRIRTWVSRGNGFTDRCFQPLSHLGKGFLGRFRSRSYSGPGGIRTPGADLFRIALYLAELQDHVDDIFSMSMLSGVLLSVLSSRCWVIGSGY